MKHNKITISILMIFVILLSVGCSNNQENISDGNENVNADYDFLFQELEEKYDATLGIYGVIHNVDHTFHAPGVNLLHERFEIVHCAVGGVHRPVVAVRVRAAERSLFASNADGMDGQEPDDIRAQCADAV